MKYSFGVLAAAFLIAQSALASANLTCSGQLIHEQAYGPSKIILPITVTLGKTDAAGDTVGASAAGRIGESSFSDPKAQYSVFGGNSYHFEATVIDSSANYEPGTKIVLSVDLYPAYSKAREALSVEERISWGRVPMYSIEGYKYPEICAGQLSSEMCKQNAIGISGLLQCTEN